MRPSVGNSDPSKRRRFDRANRQVLSTAVEQDRRTKIVATIGPSSESPERLRALVAAGMNAARLNLSHGTHEEHAERVRRIREVEAEMARPIALIADLQGPKLRIG